MLCLKKQKQAKISYIHIATKKQNKIGSNFVGQPDLQAGHVVPN